MLLCLFDIILHSFIEVCVCWGTAESVFIVLKYEIVLMISKLMFYNRK